MERNPTEKIWNDFDGRIYLQYPSIRHEKLPNAIYSVHQDQNGAFYLTKIADKYEFDYKVYGLESKFIQRVLKTYTHQDKNLGVLLNGVKGTGKTVSCKTICNVVDQPTILVHQHMEGVQYFLNSIPQNITIFIDEYEKIYGQSNEMLTIMDGAFNSEFKRLFLLTTNKLYIEDNLKERPSRIRYLKKFGDLAPEVVSELVDDILEHTQLREDCINFITTLEIITVDIVKEILNEVNIHSESPFEFGDIFNISFLDGKYKIYNVDEHGNEKLAMDNVKLYPRPDFDADEHEGRNLDINGSRTGKILRVLNKETIMVGDYQRNDDGDLTNIIDKVYVLRLQKTYGTHSNYAYDYDGYGYGSGSANSTVVAEGLTNILVGKSDKEIAKLKAFINEKKKG